MRLALNLNYSGAAVALDTDKVLEAERLGYSSVWSAEAYGSDAVTPVAWLAARTTRIHVGTAIMQIAGRTPACTAMTAMTLDALSGGRFRLGLGVSGPQVVEGWHGQAFGKPLKKTREYVEVVRAILRREKPVEYRGEYYQIPYAGSDATGLGKPLKSILHGRAGGMGARGRNFYNDVARRYGYEAAAKTIQDLYLAGRKDEAVAAVPDALVDEVALCGPRERIRERVAEWNAAGVTTLMVAGDAAAVRLMAEVAL